MNNLANQIMKKQCKKDEVSLYWLGGAGFVVKAKGITIGLDLYLSDVCRNEKGDFKRLVPAPLKPEEIKLDYLIASHEHGDHLDAGSVDEFFAPETTTVLIGPGTVTDEGKKLGIDPSRIIKLDRNESINIDGAALRGVFADHGDLSPDAIGLILSINGKSIYFTGDTCYRPDLFELVPLKEKIDVLIVPVNGKYGNPDSKDAAYFTAWVKPEIVVPCHFWLFKEHGGDPGKFVECCSEIAPQSKVEVLAIGEELRI